MTIAVPDMQTASLIFHLIIITGEPLTGKLKVKCTMPQ